MAAVASGLVLRILLTAPRKSASSSSRMTCHVGHLNRTCRTVIAPLLHAQCLIGLSGIGPYNSLNSRAPRARSAALGSHKFYIYLLEIPEIILFLEFLIYYILFNLINIIF
jgi:hypothetical protein